LAHRWAIIGGGVGEKAPGLKVKNSILEVWMGGNLTTPLALFDAVIYWQGQIDR